MHKAHHVHTYSTYIQFNFLLSHQRYINPHACMHHIPTFITHINLLHTYIGRKIHTYITTHIHSHIHHCTVNYITWHWMYAYTTTSHTYMHACTASHFITKTHALLFISFEVHTSHFITWQHFSWRHIESHDISLFFPSHGSLVHHTYIHTYIFCIHTHIHSISLSYIC